MTPSGRPSTRTSAVIMPAPKLRRSSSTRAGVGERLDHARARRTRAAGSRGRSRAARAGRRTPSARARPGSRTDTASRRATASASSATATSTTPFGVCTSMRPDFLRAHTPSPPPSIMAGPPMPMLEPAVAMITSQQPSSAALPAKQRPGGDADQRHQPREPAKSENARQSRPATPTRRCRPAARRRPPRRTRSAAAARSASSNMRSFLRWFCWPCVPASTV